jgi:hypothetical protein
MLYSPKNQLDPLNLDGDSNEDEQYDEEEDWEEFDDQQTAP